MKNQMRTLLEEYSLVDVELFKNLNINQYVKKILNNATIVYITKKGVLKAFIAYYDNSISKDEAYLSMLMVSRDFQGLGFGKQLLNTCIHDISNQGFKTFKLEVKNTNSKAINFYKEYGFSVEKTIDDSLFMIKTL